MKSIKSILLLITLIVTSINLFSQTAEEWKELGNIEKVNENYSKAIEYYQKSIEADSNYFAPYYNLGSTYALLDDFDKAIEYYNKALALNEGDPDMYFALGSAYGEMQNYDKAIELFKEGLLLKGDSAKEYYYLSYLYQEAGNTTYSILYLKKAAQMGDTDAQHFFIVNEIPWEDDFRAPDYKQIKSNIKKKKSNLYYPNLWKRYNLGDGTMTLEEKRHLYYGYVFNKNYAPYTSGDTKIINSIMLKEELTIEDWEEIATLFNATLEVTPFSCRDLYYQSIAYHHLNKMSEMEVNYNKISCIIDALKSTGDALTKESAMHVISISGEYDYLFINDLEMQQQILTRDGYDLLILAPNEYGIEEMWFNIDKPREYLYKSFK